MERDVLKKSGASKRSTSQGLMSYKSPLLFQFFKHRMTKCPGGGD